MFPENIEVIDLGSWGWSNLLKISSGFPGGDKRPCVALIVYRGLKVLTALDLNTGSRIDVDFQGTSRLAPLAKRHGFDRVIAVEENSLTRIIDRASERIDPDTDYLEQWSAFTWSFKQELGRSIFTFPPGMFKIPYIPYPLMDVMTRILIPDDSVIALVITSEGRAFGSIVLGYRGGDFWLLSTLDAIGAEDMIFGPGSDFEVTSRLAARFGGKVRGIFLDLSALERIALSNNSLVELLGMCFKGKIRFTGIPFRWMPVLGPLCLLCLPRRLREKLSGSPVRSPWSRGQIGANSRFKT